MRARIPVIILFAVLTVRVHAQEAEVPAATPGIFPVTAYGAKGDGITDDTSAFADAISKASKAGGGIAWVPAGRYLIKGNLTVASGVTLQGVAKAPPSNMVGSVLLTTAGKGQENGTPFITLLANSTLEGLCVFYPEQNKDKPEPYPWCVQGIGDDCAIRNVLLVNPWQAVDFGTHPCGRHYVKGLYAEPIRRGVYVDRCYDIGRLEDVHLWPFWTVSSLECAAGKLRQEQGEGFIFGRSDWEYVSNSFAIMYHAGIHLVRSADTNAGGGNYLFTQSGADVSDYALLVDETQDHSGISFSNSQLFGDIDIRSSNNGMIRFTGCGFFGSLTGKHGTAMARIAGRGRVSFDNCSFHCIDPRNRGRYLIVADSGRLGITGCQFVTSEFTAVNPVPVYLGPNVISAIITGNEFNGKARIVNQSGGQVRIADNTEDTERAYQARVEGRAMIPLPMVRAGTEVTTLVPNGGFEKQAAAGPAAWARIGDVTAGPPVAPLPPGMNGRFVELARPGQHNLPAGLLQQTVTLKPNTEYVLSAYVWNFSRPNATLMANVDVGLDSPGYLRLALGPGMESASRGYFLYARFNSGKTGTKTMVRAFFDGPSKFADPRAVAAQWDNVAITEASRFRPPQFVKLPVARRPGGR